VPRPLIVCRRVPSEEGPTYRYLNVRQPDGSLICREKYEENGQSLKLVESHQYHEDGLGSTLAMTDQDADVTDKYSYDAWGNATHGTGTTADNPYQYVGQLGYYTHHQESTLGLLQLGVRYYDPGVGRFTQRDPALRGSGSYAYAGDSPVLYEDPDGRFPTIEHCGKKKDKKHDDVENALKRICDALKAGKCQRSACVHGGHTGCHLKICESGHVQCEWSGYRCLADSCAESPPPCFENVSRPFLTITLCDDIWNPRPGRTCDTYPGTPGHAVMGNILHEMNHLCGDCSEEHNDTRAGNCLRDILGVR